MAGNRILGYHIPPVHSPFFETVIAAMDLTNEERAVAVGLHERGYATVDLRDGEFDGLAAGIIADMDGRYPPNQNRLHHQWRRSPAARRLATNPKILGILAKVYGRRPIPFMSLNFEVGSEQRCHSDAIFFGSVPRGFMCGVWVALEDADADNGPLQYYPGSHLEPYVAHDILGRRAIDYALGRNRGRRMDRHFANFRPFEDYWEDLIATRGWQREILTCPKGTALIWAANLLHGGMPIRNRSRTRHSQVTHYYFADCFYYKALWSDPMLGFVRQAKVVDIGTGRRVASTYGGRRVRLPLRDWLQI